MTGVASVAAIREAFPSLSRLHAGKSVAYFDGPGGTQVPGQVVDAMADYLLHHNANTHWVYPTSQETDALLADARDVFAQFFGGTAEEVSFGNNMTTIAFHIARALGRDWREGDEVIVTELDHHGNVAPWQALARERGIVLKWLPLDLDTFQLRLDRLEELLGPRTRLLALGAASNILGTVNDVAAATRMARDAGVLVFVDGVHYAPHFLPDVVALGCDFFACSAYKFHGPHVGVLWRRRELLDRLDVPRLDPAPSQAPERLETGTQNHEGIVGAAAAVRWLASLSAPSRGLRRNLATVYHEIHRRETALFRRLWDGLHAMDGITCYGPGPATLRTPTLSLTVRGMASERVATILADDSCFVSNGDFYATTVATLLGHEADGLVRIGAAPYTTMDEIDRVLDAIARLIP